MITKSGQDPQNGQNSTVGRVNREQAHAAIAIEPADAPQRPEFVGSERAGSTSQVVAGEVDVLSAERRQVRQRII